MLKGMKWLCGGMLVLSLVLMFVPVMATTTWQATGGPLGGSINALAINPLNPREIYAGSFGGGVFKTTDGGNSWNPTGSFKGYDIINSVAIDSAGIIYSGTQGGGIFKSSDGGGTWSAINNGMTNLNISFIAIAPTNNQTIYASARSATFKSTDGGNSWNAVNNNWPSQINCIAIDPKNSQKILIGSSAGTLITTDGGNSWLDSGILGATQLIIDTNNPQNIYANLGGLVMQSSDGGSSWSTFFNLPPLSNTNFVIDPNDQNTIYVAATTGIYKIIKSVDGGISTSRTASNNCTSLIIDPTDSTRILAGTFEGGIIGSSDAGFTWVIKNTGLTAMNVMGLALATGSSRPLYAAAVGGGLLKSTNAGDSWSTSIIPPNGGNYIPYVTIDPTNSQTLFVGQPSGILKSTDGGDSWALLQPGSQILSLAIDPNNNQTIYAGATYGAGVFKSLDGGTSWKPVKTGLTGTRIWTIAIDPSNSLNIYAGSDDAGVFRSNDGGNTWKAPTRAFATKSVSSLVIDQNNSHTIYAGTDGGVFKSTDSADTWNTVNNSVTGLSVTAIAIDPSNSQTIFAGSNHNGMFKSFDGGNSWSDINSGLTNTRISSIAIDPTGHTVYVGTKNGGVFKGISYLDSSPPIFNGVQSTAFTVGTTTSFTVTATGMPIPSLTMTSGILPQGISFTNGIISGTPVQGTAGTYNLTFTASNGLLPDATQTFVLTVNPQQTAPVFSSAPSTTFSVGTGGSFRVTATGSPMPSISLTNGALPSGVTFANGVLSGI